ncbi:MAG: DNA polymerase I, partial [Rhodothermales bacterium]
MAPSSGSDREKLYLLDAMALAYRAHFALISRPLVTSDGLDTSAIFGFTQSLLKLLDEHPDHIAVVFDPPGGKSFRDDLFEEYKANRPPMPEPLREAIPHIKELVEAFDIPVVEVEGMEAD